MQLKSMRNNQGFTLLETIIGVIIFVIVLNIIAMLSSNYIHQYRMAQNSEKISSIPIAVQRRAAHDGFLFSPWANNGGQAELPSPLVWEENELEAFFEDYLVGRKHPGCGNAAAGWNPINSDGTIDGGEETQMERTALIGCNDLRGTLPYNVKMSAALSMDSTDAVGTFALYLDMSEVNFGEKNTPENNILNYTQFKQQLMSSMTDSQNGVPEVRYGLANALNDMDDDTVYTSDECEAQLKANAPCDIIVQLNFSGTTNGMFKRTDNQNSFVDDVTFKTSSGVADKQKCAYWEETSPDVWSQSVVDCAIKAGSGDDNVVLVFDASQANEFVITNETNLNHVCRLYEVDADSALMPQAAPSSPCGLLQDGAGIVQLITNEIHADDILGKKIVAEQVFAGKMTLHSDGNGDLLIEGYNASHTVMTFSLSNNGDVFADGTLTVNGNATFNANALVNGDLTAVNDVNMALNGNSTLSIGNPAGGESAEITDDGEFSILHKGNRFKIQTGSQGEGLALANDAAGTEMKLKANKGIVVDNSSHIHAAVSTLTNQVFNASNQQTDLEKLRSRLVTADMAKFLDDTSSPIQIVGIDRIEGEFTSMQKPDCLAFANDSNYSSPESNPYRQLIDSNRIDTSKGRDYARLVLLPMYFKTYNSAFGDNQIFAQHASHATATTWDIYLYLSGEGAFSTGAREDGAGGSLAMTLCDYSGIDFSGQQF